MSNPAYIAVDWGTSSFRLWMLDRHGDVLAERRSGEGMTVAAASGFGAILDGHLAAIAAPAGLPVLVCGMAGARQGWVEAGYVDLPAPLDAILTGAVSVPGQTRDVRILPGLAQRRTQAPDVMRGEETQLVGLMEEEPAFRGVAILPGTHSKWASVGDGTIGRFQTFMTGEMFELLARKSFLRHSVAEHADDIAASPHFALAVKRSTVEGLPFLAAIFSVRVRQLLDGVSGDDNLAYLSGLVIGGEIAAARQAGLLAAGQPIRIIGSRSLASAYLSAFAIAGHAAEARDGSALVRLGLVRIARANAML